MADFPTKGAMPYGAKLKTYIDEADAATSSAAASATATRATKPDLTTGLKRPFFIAHRGGHLIYGEHSLEAYTAMAEAGYAIEPDINILSDGGLACIHDATTTRTMTQIAGAAQANVNAITSAAFVRDYRILPEMQGSPYEKPVLFPDVLDLFGGKTLIVPEMKDTATRVAVCDEIVKRGLEKAVIAQSFNFADVEYSASRGIVSAWLTDSGSPASMVAAGIKYAAPSSAATDAYVDSCRNAGLGIIRWTINSRAQADTMIAANRGDGFFSDDPDWVSGRMQRSYTDPFRAGRPWPHMVSSGLRASQMFKDGGIGFRHAGGALTTTGSPNDWAMPIPSGRARIYFTLAFGPDASAVDRWAGIAFGQFANSEAPFVDAATPGQSGWHVLLRRNGGMNIYEVLDNTTATPRAVGVVPGTPLAAVGRASVDIPLMFERSATNVTLTNLLSGESLTWASATSMPANARFQFTFNGSDAVVKNVRVEPLA